MKILAQLACICLFTYEFSAARGGGLDTWVARPVTGALGMSFWDVAFGKGSWVAVGRNGAAVSHDGTNWIKVAIPAQAPLIGVVFGAGLFVTVSAEETPIPNAFGAKNFAGAAQILTSADGEHWSLQTASPKAYFVLNSDSSIPASPLDGRA